MAERGTLIGTGKCKDCGKTVRLKTNTNGIVYYFCDGRADAGMCGGSHKWGPWHSREIVAKLTGAKPAAVKPETTKAPASDDAGNPSDGAKNDGTEQRISTPAATAIPAGKPAGKLPGKRPGGIFG